MFTRGLAVVTCLCLAALALAGCFTSAPEDGLAFTGPIEHTLAPGETLPGANIRFVRYGPDGAEVLINDQAALKKQGDSLDWRGAPVPGVAVSMTQRIVLANEERLTTLGTATVTVRDVQPALALFPGRPAFTYKVAMTHIVKQGDTIPGTLLTYKGKTEEGAEFAGVTGYPYRKIGDSVVWTGQLRPNVYLDATFRVVAYTDDLVTVAALANLGLTQ